MFSNYKFTAAEQFLKYVRIDTQSNPQSTTFPSTEKQKDLSKVLVEELLEIGVSDAHLDEWGYVYATIPSTTEKKVPVVCFYFFRVITKHGKCRKRYRQLGAVFYLDQMPSEGRVGLFVDCCFDQVIQLRSRYFP